MPRTARQIPWVEPDDAGTFYVHWYDQKAKRTKRLSLKTSDPEIAQGLYAEFLAEKDAVEDKPARRVMSVADVLDFYFDEHVENKVLAAKRQMFAIRALKVFLADDAVSAIDRSRCAEYGEHRRKAGVQDATIRRELNVLRAAAKFCFMEKRINDADMPRVVLPADSPPRQDKWLTFEQVMDLHDKAADERAKRFIWLAYWTAGRKKAVYGLKKSQVSFPQNQIDLHPPGRPRSKKRNAVIAIPKSLREPLAEWMAESPNDYVLGAGTEPRKGFEAAVKAAGLDAMGVSPHWLRHSRATHMLLDGVDPYRVARYLGDTLVTVDRVYGHITPSELEDI